MEKRRKIGKIIDILWVCCALGSLTLLGLINASLFISGSERVFREESNSFTVENTIAESIKYRVGFVHLNGAGARVLQQKMLNNVILDKDRVLYTISDMNIALDIKTQTKAAQEVDKIYNLCQEMGIKFLYAQRPIKYPETKLPYGYQDIASPALEKYRLNYCKMMGEPCINLRAALGSDLQFYVTDHHWTVETAYNAARCIEEELGHSTAVYDAANFSRLTYKNCFLGSMGIRTGIFFGGIDDIEFLIPTFATDFKYQHYINHELTLEKEGAFADAFLDYDMLNNFAYFNKYNAVLNGSLVETRMINNIAPNNLTVLVIADSYGRAMTPYTALNYYETRYLDPQDGRYNDNYLNYIREYNPDIVIEMAYEEINVGEE